MAFYFAKMKDNHIEGIINISDKGSGTVGDILVPFKYVNGAFDGDLVEVIITEYKNAEFKGSRAIGKVLRIIEPSEPFIVGCAHFTGGQFILVADNADIKFPIMIDNAPEELKEDDKVVVRLIKRPGKFQGAHGLIEEIIGGGKEPGIDLTSIVAGMKIKRKFPEDVLEEIRDIPTELSEEDIQKEIKNGRRDIRGLSIVTIDGEDTKDVDDGVSISKNEDGTYNLGVHIADVTHYVKEGSPLDREAQERGTSVYIPDRVIPMLPRKLSNGICSLNEGADRFAFSVQMKIDKYGNIIDSEIFKSVINVKYKITYKQIYRLFTEKTPSLINKYASHLEELELMKELQEVLLYKRQERGSVDFNLPETKVILDENGIPIKVEAAEKNFANDIIEEFMLLANETVATQFFYMGAPFVYRVHRRPSPEKIDDLRDTISGMGFTLKGGSEPHSREIASLLKNVEGSRKERVITSLALRSMQKAEYSASNEGHYALALDNYCHFTSPIRRYPDLQIHRIMKLILDGKMSDEKEQELRTSLSDIAEHCSATERRAEEAERRCVRYKVCEYMSQYIGERFEGIISGMASFGMFVELPNTVEGFIDFSSLSGYYEFDRRNFTAVNRHSGHCYRLGDTVKIKVSGIDARNMRVGFVIDDNRPKRVKYTGKKKIKIYKKKRR